jgi:hypothetical protein
LTLREGGLWLRKVENKMKIETVLNLTIQQRIERLKSRPLLVSLKWMNVIDARRP